MESAHSAGNAELLFRLIRETGPKSSTVSETIRDKNGTVIMDESSL